MNTTTLDNLRDVILAWCNNITGRTQVLANTGEQAQLNSPYVEVFIDQYDSPVFQKSIISEDGETETIEAVTFLSVQLDLYGGSPLQDGSKLQRSLWSQKRYLDLWQICGLSSTDSTLDLTALQTGTRKQRAQFKFLVYCVLTDDFESDFINTIDVTLEVNDKGSFPITLTNPNA